MNSIVAVVAGLLIGTVLCWLVWIPYGIYGMIIRKRADKGKDAAFPYMRYFTWDESHDYAIAVAISVIPKVALVLGIVDLIMYIVFRNSFEPIFTIALILVIIHFANKYRKKKEEALKERFGENPKPIFKKMFSIGIGRMLWEIPVGLTIVGLIILWIVGCFASASAATPEETRAKRENDLWNDYLNNRD